MTTKKTMSGDVTTNWRLKFLVAALHVNCQEQISASSGSSFDYKYIFPLFNKILMLQKFFIVYIKQV